LPERCTWWKVATTGRSPWRTRWPLLPARPDDIVLVHDAVRPLIDAATIERTIDAVSEHGAAIVGLPAVDTIKQVERTAHGALITATIPRESIVQAQTPQGFRFNLLQRAFAEATADGFVGTDEASVVERAGLSGGRGARFSG
jgi:2-C-methyl-D-erythritol 4-phosphate cytidylyltransferase